jgi:hypothetical protein
MMIDRRGFVRSMAGGALGLVAQRPARAVDLRNTVGRAAFIPKIAGNFWRIAGNPDLGPLTSPGQQPVDFAIWQAADGTWQLGPVSGRQKPGARHGSSTGGRAVA